MPSLPFSPKPSLPFSPKLSLQPFSCPGPISLISHERSVSVSHLAGWQARLPQWWPARGFRETEEKEEEKKKMSKDPAEAVAAMAKILEGWAAMQEHQTAAQAEQLEALQVQAGLQTQALVQLAGGGDSASWQTPRIHLPKMTAEDNAQAFLEAFEVAAEACHWPREEWVVRLLPLLSGEAQQAAHSLPPSARGVYQNLRKAVLDRTGYSPEEQRPLRLCPASDGPRQTVAAAWNPVRGGRRGAGRTGEVCDRAAGGHGTWVRCHRPSSLSAAVTLAEDHMVHCPAPPRGEKPEPASRRKFLPRAAVAATARGPSANLPNPSPHWFSQTPGSMTVRPKPQGVPQTSGPECWRCGQLGHWRRECPLMEVGQVVQVVGPLTVQTGRTAFR